MLFALRLRTSGIVRPRSPDWVLVTGENYENIFGIARLRKGEKMKKINKYSDEQLIEVHVKYGPELSKVAEKLGVSKKELSILEMRPSSPEDASVAEALARRLLDKEKKA